MVCIGRTACAYEIFAKLKEFWLVFYRQGHRIKCAGMVIVRGLVEAEE